MKVAGDICQDSSLSKTQQFDMNAQTDEPNSSIDEYQSKREKLPHRSNTSFHYVRYCIIILGAHAMGAMFMARNSITVAMLSMVNHTHLYLVEHPNATSEDFFSPGYVERGEFNWTNEVQQIIIAGYMVAYTLPQVFTARLSMMIGMRIATSICLLICGVSCLLSPLVADWGWEWLLVLRLLNGFGASSMLPSMIGAIESWIPYESSANGLALLQFVQTFIYVLTPLIAGELAAIHWKWALYVPGLVCVVIAIVWYIFARDTPDLCPFISQKEIDLINGVESDPENFKPNSKGKAAARSSVPWYFMFKICSFYYLVIIWMLYCCSFGGLLFLLPSYFHKVLKISVQENGFYNFVIQIGVIFSMLWPNPVVNFLQNRYNMSLTTSRRLIAFLYSFMATTTLAYIAAYHEHQIILISINRFFHMTNDTIITATLMSQYGREGLSTLAYSMMNTFGNLASVFFCWAIGKFLDYTGESLECWSWVLLTMCILNVIIFLVYAILVKSEPLTIRKKQ